MIVPRCKDSKELINRSGQQKYHGWYVRGEWEVKDRLAFGVMLQNRKSFASP